MTKINKKFVKKLWKEKDNENLIIKIEKLSKINNPYLNFVLCALFNNIECPAYFKILFQSKKILSYLIKKWLNIDISENNDEHIVKKRKLNISNNQELLIKLLEFLLLIERKFKKIAYLDRNFIDEILESVSEENKIKLIKYSKVTLLSILISKNIETSKLPLEFKQYHEFCKVETLPYELGFKYFDDKKIDYKILKKNFLQSRHPEIKIKYKKLNFYYPEKMFGLKTIPQNRMDYFIDPLSLPLNIKLLKAYIPSILTYLKLKNEGKRSISNIDVLFKMIFIERIFLENPSKNLLRKFVHQMILESPVIIKVLMMRKFDIKLIKRVVNCIPSFYLAYDICLKQLCKTPEDIFYMKMFRELLKKYPLVGYIEKFEANSHFLSNSLKNEFNYLIEEFNTNK